MEKVLKKETNFRNVLMEDTEILEEKVRGFRELMTLYECAM